MGDKRAICILASNKKEDQGKSISYYICKKIFGALDRKGISCELLNLRNYVLSPCTGCGACRVEDGCGKDNEFNRIYEKLSSADYLFFVSPQSITIPAKLCILFEKMEQVSFRQRGDDYNSQSELHGKLAGIISYDKGDNWSRGDCKIMVHDTISIILAALGLKVIPYNSEWNTGIFLTVRNIPAGNETLLVKEHDWKIMEETVRRYVEVIVQTSKSLHAIC
ncbi:MAG: flavodoxin family protein [Lachnospiraceae bacterium]|jgi:hypothetical protein|nr:flavodoxin family protein [Lachnospiraceae bacterium]